MFYGIRTNTYEYVLNKCPLLYKGNREYEYVLNNFIVFSIGIRTDARILCILCRETLATWVCRALGPPDMRACPPRHQISRAG